MTAKKQSDRNAAMETLANLPIMHFPAQKDWERWLEKNHASPTGVWLRIAKKSSSSPSVTYKEALDVALCYGWIDGQKQKDSEHTWLQKFTPRGKKSIWSKINREKAMGLVKSGHMQPAGLREMERAKSDGRWDAAYDSFSKATVPPDLQAAFDNNARAYAFFKTLDSGNRYAVLFRIQTVKKAETRARKIVQFIGMFERKEKLHN